MQFDISAPATWIPIVAGVIIPFVVALLAKANASGAVKSLIAVVSAALVALGLYLGDASHAQSWKGAASIFVLTLVTAAASRVTVTGGADTALQNATGGFGVGGSAPHGPTG